ncbi:MAG: methyltransferase domain-containing protein [Planctomycetota bacterium]|nr:methyltransferase domain-containing protein [Planctomycetaceae bacterium]MDQ3329070.1 methyltransferase domain-containing protein [Planctomycetota bacterium]
MSDAPDESLLSRLRSPENGRRLLHDEARSALVCAEAAREWPVIAGIPRFTSSEHLESFGRQWNRYEVVHDDEDRATFVAKTGIELSELAGLKVLDAGCGGGRYCKVTGEAVANVVGVDHTTAVEKASRLCAHLPNVDFVQADLKRLPFEDESFDVVFSIGVMHHDVETRAVFDAVARKVKPGGRYAVWLYRRNQWWQERINTALRRRTTSMDGDRLERLCRIGAGLGAIPLVNKTLNKVVNFSAHPDAQNRLCDTFDWYAPAYQHHHTTDEVLGWFRDAGFEELRVLPPEKTGRLYRWTYEKNLLIGSGVNVAGRRRR